MSNVIQSRHQAARHASLFQQRPGILMDAVEDRELHATLRQTSSIVGTVVLINSDYRTGGPAVIERDAGASRRSPSEWARADDVWASWAETTRILLQHVVPDTSQTSSAAARLRVDRLAAIQASLGLSTSAVAEVLGISRPTLYKWLDASKAIDLQEASRVRFATVESLARAWRDRSVAPLARLVHEPLAGGSTIHELLKADPIAEAAALAAFDELLARLQAQPKSLSQKMSEAGFARRPSARAVPDDE